MTEDAPSNDDGDATANEDDDATASNDGDATESDDATATDAPVVDGWAWSELFDATSDLDVTEADVRDALRAHREAGDA